MKLLFVDTETGGLDPQKHSLLQIAFIAYDTEKPGDYSKRLNLFVRQPEYVVTSEAMNVNKIDIAKLKQNGITPEECFVAIGDFIHENFGNEKAILVGHNVAFDKGFLMKFYKDKDYNFENVVSHRTIDTMSLLWGLKLKDKYPLESCSSAGAFKYFKINNVQAHDAMSDCEATVQLLEKIMETM